MLLVASVLMLLYLGAGCQLDYRLHRAVSCIRDCNCSTVLVDVSIVNATCQEWWHRRSHASMSTAKPLHVVTI